MSSEDFIGITKAISTLASGIFGVIALIKENKNKTGQITKWGKIALIGVFLSAGFALALQVFESSKAKQDAIEAKNKSDSTTLLLNNIIAKANQSIKTQELSLGKTLIISTGMDTALGHLKLETQRTKTIANGMNTSLRSQQQLLNEQVKSQKQILRAYYPIEPLTLFYEKEYPMDQVSLKDYTARVQANIISYLTEARQGRGITSNDLKSEKDIIFIISNDSTWLPTNSEKERSAMRILSSDWTSFEFIKMEKNDTSKIKFSSVPSYIPQMLVKLTPKGEIKQKIEIQADFTRRVFIQKVRCDNPMRTGDDLISMSSIDLINRKIKWGEVTNSSEWTLQKFGLKFQYDYDDENKVRYIKIPYSSNSVILKIADVGLQGVLSTIKPVQ